MNFEGRKFSKSRNYAVYLGEFLEKFSADTLRYSIAVNYPENKDTDFSWQDYQNRTNGELADTLGNFIKRSVDFTNTRFEGQVPYECTVEDWNSMGVNWPDTLEQLDLAFEQFHFREAVSLGMDIARAANRFLTESEPWKTIKSDRKAAAKAMALSLNLCHALSIVLYPVIPETCNRIHAMLGFQDTIEDCFTPGTSLATSIMHPTLKQGHRLRENSEILFTKIDDAELAPELKKIEALLAEAEKREAGAEQNRMEFKPVISFDDFLKVDLRVGKVIAAEAVKKAGKLLKLKVQVGSVTRQVLAGIARYYTPEEMVGKNVVLVANLADRTIRDEVSEGMILAVEGTDGKLFVIEPSGNEINGRQIQ